MSYIARVLVLFGVTSSLGVAGQQGSHVGSVEIPTGQTTYLQLASTVATGTSTNVIRVQNPGRDHSVIKVTYEAGASGAANKLRIRNGYDRVVYLRRDAGLRPSLWMPVAQFIGTMRVP